MHSKCQRSECSFWPLLNVITTVHLVLAAILLVYSPRTDSTEMLVWFRSYKTIFLSFWLHEALFRCEHSGRAPACCSDWWVGSRDQKANHQHLWMDKPPVCHFSSVSIKTELSCCSFWKDIGYWVSVRCYTAPQMFDRMSLDSVPPLLHQVTHHFPVLQHQSWCIRSTCIRSL